MTFFSSFGSRGTRKVLRCSSAGSTRGRSWSSSSLAISRSSASPSSASLSETSARSFRYAWSAATVGSSEARSLATFRYRSPLPATAGSESRCVSSSSRCSMASSFLRTSGDSMGALTYRSRPGGASPRLPPARERLGERLDGPDVRPGRVEQDLSTVSAARHRPASMLQPPGLEARQRPHRRIHVAGAGRPDLGQDVLERWPAPPRPPCAPALAARAPPASRRWSRPGSAPCGRPPSRRRAPRPSCAARPGSWRGARSRCRRRSHSSGAASGRSERKSTAQIRPSWRRKPHSSMSAPTSSATARSAWASACEVGWRCGWFGGWLVTSAIVGQLRKTSPSAQAAKAIEAKAL